jgi:hypothetical protein
MIAVMESDKSVFFCNVHRGRVGIDSEHLQNPGPRMAGRIYCG